jgi:polar amino acid transport system substrate-binding protein
MPALQHAFDKYGVSPRSQQDITCYLDALKIHDIATYKHSLRVGLLAARIAEAMGFSPKALLWAGLLHDIGKMLIETSLLRKTDSFTSDDLKKMEPHVEYGYRILNNEHAHTAAIIVRHHRFSNHPYPAIIPPLPEAFKAREQIIEQSARILALADYYDALTTRRDRFLEGETRRERFLRDNEDVAYMITVLESRGVIKL